MLALADYAPKLIAILRGVTVAEALPAADAIAQAGLGIIEVTLNSPDPFASIRKVADAHGERMLVGAGTVLSATEVDQVAEAGGKLIVSPNFNPEVVRRTKELGLISVPGCLTPTEMFAALDCGADMLKIFPATMVSPATVRGIRAVLPKDALVAVTGGVNRANLRDYLEAGADGAGLGSDLYQPGKDVAAIGEAARAYVAALAG